MKKFVVIVEKTFTASYEINAGSASEAKELLQNHFDLYLEKNQNNPLPKDCEQIEVGLSKATVFNATELKI